MSAFEDIPPLGDLASKLMDFGNDEIQNLANEAHFQNPDRYDELWRFILKYAFRYAEKHRPDSLKYDQDADPEEIASYVIEGSGSEVTEEGKVSATITRKQCLHSKIMEDGVQYNQPKHLMAQINQLVRNVHGDMVKKRCYSKSVSSSSAEGYTIWLRKDDSGDTIEYEGYHEDGKLVQAECWDLDGDSCGEVSRGCGTLVFFHGNGRKREKRVYVDGEIVEQTNWNYQGAVVKAKTAASRTVHVPKESSLVIKDKITGKFKDQDFPEGMGLEQAGKEGPRDTLEDYPNAYIKIDFKRYETMLEDFLKAFENKKCKRLLKYTLIDRISPTEAQTKMEEADIAIGNVSDTFKRCLKGVLVWARGKHPTQFEEFKVLLGQHVRSFEILPRKDRA